MNRYIKAMEIGNKYEKEGISYFDLIKQITGSEEKKFARESEITFFIWFVDNFNTAEPSLTYHSMQGLIAGYLSVNETNKTYHKLSHSAYKVLHEDLGKKWFLNGQASKQYIDYLELVEARSSSKKAIGIAIVAILITGIISFLDYTKPDSTIPVPPYEVKVIENNPKVQKLEKEVKDLRNELHKAEMLISSFESKK